MLHNLYAEAEQNEIDVIYYPMKGLTAIAAPCTDGYIIGMDVDRLDTTAHETVCLAHEIGHCRTGSFYNINSAYDVVGRHEARANAWAFKKLIPISDLKELLKLGITEIWEIAEYFEVTDEFTYKALTYYGLITK